MNYPLPNSNFQNRRRNARLKIFWSLIILILILIFLSTPWARRVLFYVANPVWQIEKSITRAFDHLVIYFDSKQTLAQENDELKNQLQVLTELKGINLILQSENDSLKNLLGRKDAKHKTVLAAVLVKPPKNLFDILLIDAGLNQGIKVGDKVIAESNVYIGEISEVFSDTSKVILYSSPGEKRAVALGTSGVAAEAVGRGGGNFSIDLPREIGAKEGDVIYIPSITPNVFGIVEKILFEDKDSFQTILFKSPINLSELNFVEILI